MPNELPFTCPFCGEDLIYIGTIPKDYFIVPDAGAKTYVCGCGKKIVSEAFLIQDKTPKIFYDNKWMFRKDGIWMFWEKGEKRNTGCWGTPIERPQRLEVKVVLT